jgi:WD40 repeat protein
MRARYSRDGTALATLGYNALSLWDGETGAYRSLIRGASWDLAFTPDGGRIAAASDAGTVRFWDAKQEQGALVHKAKQTPYEAHFSADGRRVIYNDAILDTSNGAVLQTLPSPKGEDVGTVVLLPDGKHTIFFRFKSDPQPRAIPTGDLILWDVEAAREIKRLAGIRGPHIDVSPDGRWLLALTARDDDASHSRSEQTVRDASTWAPVLTRKDPPVYGRYAVFLNDSKSILLGQEDRVALIEVPTGREQATYGPLSSHPLAIAVSRDGRWVAAAPSASAGGTTVHVWDAASGAEVQVIPQTAGENVTTLSFSPDGRRLAAAGSGAKIKIWDTETGLELLTLTGHTSWIWTMSFSPDGRRILSGSGDKTVRIWDASPLPPEAASSH